MTVWVVTAAMLLTSLPLLTVPVEAASISDKYTYVLKVKTANEKGAKSDNDIYCIIKDARGNERSIKLDNKGDDFKKGAWGTYNLSLDLQPWEIHAVGFQHKKGLDPVKIEKFEFYLPDGTMYSKTINTWFDKYKKTYGIAGTTDRKITSRGNFDTEFGRTEYYDPETVTANDVSPRWNGLVSDQYFSNYSIFNYNGAVGIDFSASGKSYNGRSGINMSVLTDNGIAKTIDNSLGYTYGMDLFRSKLLKYMQENQIYKFTLTSKLDYLWEYDEYDSFSKTWTIIRKGFDLGAPVAVTKAYTPVRDQNFYNSNSAYSTFEIKIPVRSFDHYDASVIAKSLADFIRQGTVPAKVYYDKVENNGYVTPKNAYSKGSDVYLVCDTPSGFNNPGSVGITVQLENAKAVCNGQTYWLDHQVSASDPSRSRHYSEYIATHKVDTAGVALDIAGGTAFDTYQKVHTFSLSEKNNEMVYLENRDGTGTEGYFSYELLTRDGKTVKALKNYKTTPTTRAPYATNAVYSVEPKETLEGEYLLRLSARDLANNPFSVTYPIKIDTIAPRVSYKLKQLAPIDGSRRNEYTFTLEDATGTGKLYYCFVPDGEKMAVPGNDIPEHTGAVESQYNKWSFINQGGAANTAAVSVAKGHNFEGTLYWYTVDAAGNDSRTEKIKGTNSAGYYHTDISIVNEDVTCKLVVEDSAPGKPSYRISFETNAANRVEYYWRGTAVETRKMVYNSGSNPGASWQTLTTGSGIQLNGEYTLVYTVITPGGTTETHTQKFLFDNTNPQIRLSLANDAVSAEKAVTVDVSDITSIERLSYQLYKADHTPVGDEVALSCGLPVVRADLMLEPDEPGMYYITVTAADVNGQTSMYSSEIFGIRNGQPVQILGQTVDFHITADEQIMYPFADTVNWVHTDYNGIPLTNQENLIFKWTVVEPVANLHMTDASGRELLKDSYVLFYRFSADGSNYGEWMKSAFPALKYDHKLESTIEVTNPIVLHEGENRIWIQAAFALPDTDPATLRSEMIATNDDQIIILDTTAPAYTIELDGMEMTANNIEGMLVFSDEYSSLDDLDWIVFTDETNGAYNAIRGVDITEYPEETSDPTEGDTSPAESEIPDGEITEGEDTSALGAAVVPNEKTLRIEVSDNGEHSIHLMDKAGNSVNVPVVVECIDKIPPDVYLESAEPITSGERQDYTLNFWVDQADDTTTEFALIRPLASDDVQFGAINPSSTPDPNHPGWDFSVNLTSDQIVWGKLPGDAPADAHEAILGHEGIHFYPSMTDIEYPNGESRTNYKVTVYGDEDVTADPTDLEEEPFILAVRTSDMLGNVTIQSIGNYMMLKNATARVRAAAAASEYAYQIAAIDLKMSVPVYIMPNGQVPSALRYMEDGRLDLSEDETVAAFVDNITDAATYYTTEPVVIVKKEESVSGMLPIFFADEAGRVYKQTLTIADPAGVRTEDPYTVYLAFVDTAPVTAELYRGAYTEPYYLDSLAQLGTAITADQLQAYDVSKTYSYYVVLRVNGADAIFTSAQSSNSSVTYETDDGETTAYYDGDFTLIDSLSDERTKVFLLNNTLNPAKSISFNVEVTETVPGGEGEEPTTRVTTVGSAYQLTLRDTTAPDIMVQYSNRGFTNQPVTATIIASDPEFMTNTDGENDDPDNTVAAGNSGIKEIALTAVEEYVPYGSVPTFGDYEYEYKKYEDVDELTVPFEENGYIGVRVTNEVGLVSYALLEVSGICTDKITDYDYSLTYYDPNDYRIEVDSYGDESVIYADIDPQKYYREVAVELSVGMDKGITVTNNGGRFTRILTAENPSFTFALRDKYGNTADVDVSFAKFDTTAPTIAIDAVPTNKTNEGYTIPLTVVDAESGIASVEAVRYTVEGTERVDVTEDTFMMSIPDSGNYAVTVTDNCGNTAKISFTVANIEKTAPQIADVKYTVAQNIKTRGEVGVKIYYNEPNVTLEKVEILPESGLTANDISVNLRESVIRFYENGSVNVTFRDEYGNTTTTPIGITNIFREAPLLKAVVTPSEDALSASVSFTQFDESNPRDLSDYYVIYHGIAPVDETGEVIRADKVKFTFVENGTYTFTVHDTLGNMTELEAEITEIDRTPPKITDVKWSYTYTDENGTAQTVQQHVTPGDEAGYNVVVDENNPATNQDITASVTTDKGTVFAGSNEEYSTEHSVIYDKDGWFNFDMTSPNGLIDSYGLGLYLIDREAPVIDGAEDLMFFENPNANAPFDLSKLAVTAKDVRYDKTVDLSDKIRYSYIYNGKTVDVESFEDLSVIGTLPYDKSMPVTVVYTVSDAVGNAVTARRTITLVGLFDTTIRVNGGYTDANGMIEVDGDTIDLTLDNFAGMAWARYESGIHTMGQMKYKGTVIRPQADGTFRLDGLSEGWYTFYVQTDLRDYFCVKVYVFAQ